jgi:HEAT repeat protein
MSSLSNDPRTISELFDAAFHDDEDEAWDAVTALHWRGCRDVLSRAILLSQAGDPRARGRGADVLGQLGIPERTFPEEAFNAVLPLLADEYLSVVRSAIFALSHIDSQRAAPQICPLAGHKDDKIRYAVTVGLCAVDTQEANQTLLKLMKDRDADVRNWATFGIGQQSDCDSGEIRTALAEALWDDDADVRYEGVIGLGKRRDRRAIRYLKILLHTDPEDVFAREASTKLVGLDESEEVATIDLLAALHRLQRWSEGST